MYRSLYVKYINLVLNKFNLFHASVSLIVVFACKDLRKQTKISKVKKMRTSGPSVL